MILRALEHVKSMPDEKYAATRVSRQMKSRKRMGKKTQKKFRETQNEKEIKI